MVVIRAEWADRWLYFPIRQDFQNTRDVVEHKSSTSVLTTGMNLS